MEDALAVSTRPRDPDRPLVCLDESSKQLTAETRLPIPMKPGARPVAITSTSAMGPPTSSCCSRRSKAGGASKSPIAAPPVDYAHVLKDLADIHFSDTRTIVLIQDNLNIHSKASLYEAFPAAEARRLVERFEWRYTPKHGSWLNLAESELAVLSRHRATSDGSALEE